VKIDLNIGSDREFSIPGALGRFEVRNLEPGMTLHRVNLRTLDDCNITGDPTPSVTPQITAEVCLTGLGELYCSTGPLLECTESTSMVLRADSGGAGVRFRKGQLVQHVGITMDVDVARQRLPGPLGRKLQSYVEGKGPLDRAESQTFTGELRRLARELMKNNRTSVSRRMREHGMALQLFAEVLHRLDETDRPGIRRREPWEIDIARNIERQIIGDPKTMLDPADLSGQYQLPADQLETIFRDRHGSSLAEFQRNHRLELARALLRESDLQIKQIAFEAGYTQVSNFSRAYSRHFGEPPKETRWRSQA
jgi:AraC-like DNA-binding protein